MIVYDNKSVLFPVPQFWSKRYALHLQVDDYIILIHLVRVLSSPGYTPSLRAFLLASVSKQLS